MLTRWNDFGLINFHYSRSSFDALRQEIDRLFSGFERESGNDPSFDPDRGALGNRTWPRIHVRDTGKELKVHAEVPGLSEKDLDITVEQTSLTLRGERATEAPEGYSVHRTERRALKFARSFTLPSRIDTKRATATLKNGVLELVLPKVAEAQPRQIQIKAS